ncbi:MAG: undecaprenyl diphosphate synthase family protein [Methanocorpusculum sp.]|nr:undecaprenyl diphosphate synthase family protein [Methanocorpusculum sp.]
MLYGIYEHKIIKSLDIFPKELCIMLAGEDLRADAAKLASVVSWVLLFPQIERLIFHISTEHPKEVEAMIPLTEASARASVTLSTPDGEKKYGSGKLNMLIVIGKSGRREITEAIAKIAKENIPADEITEETIEKHLLYQVSPDFVIKTGGNHLTDFLIWQSVYSELFFTDINWKNFRRVDFLRALRDYQSRNRRFGK